MMGRVGQELRVLIGRFGIAMLCRIEQSNHPFLQGMSLHGRDAWVRDKLVG